MVDLIISKSFDIFLALLMLVLGALVGPFFQRLFFQHNEADGKIKITITNRVEKVIEEKIIVKDERKILNKYSSKEQSQDDVFMYIIGFIFIGAILVYYYVKYQYTIILSLILSTLFILSMTFSAIYYSTKRKVSLDNSLRVLLGWVIIISANLPFASYFLLNPLYSEQKNINEVAATLNAEGVTGVFNYGAETYFFYLYQALGAVFIIFLIVLLLSAVTYTWAIINIEINSHFQTLWKFLYKYSRTFSKDTFFYIGYTLFILVVIYLYVSGVLINKFIK